MEDGEKRFLQELIAEIEDCSEKDSIIQDYKDHIEELLREQSVEKEYIYQFLIEKIGHPEEIGQLWKEEIRLTPHNMQWLFVILNLFILIGGTIFILSYSYFSWAWLQKLWHLLHDISFLLIFIYILFWALLGYEMGREFGHRGARLLKRTFFIAIFPNMLVIYLMVLKILPYERFEAFLKLPFIMIFIIFILILYPVSWFGYLWGKKRSV